MTCAQLKIYLLQIKFSAYIKPYKNQPRAEWILNAPQQKLFSKESRYKEIQNLNV